MKTIGQMSSATLFATALLFATSAAAQGPKLSDIQKNIERCNRTDSKSADEQISGCTALIQSDGNTPKVWALPTTIEGTHSSPKANTTVPSKTSMNPSRLNPTAPKHITIVV